MQFKHLKWSLIVVSLLVAGKAGVSQVVPTATAGNGQAFTVGAGGSSFNMDWGHGRMVGATLWADWHPKQVPGRLYGLGLEAEARDISANPSSTQPPNFRQDTAGGGVIYNWSHYPRFRPYGKFLISFGSIDFQIQRNPAYTHETRTVYTSGGGFDYRVWGPVLVRADYEYQFWPSFLGNTLDPQGFTIGVAYAFGSGFGR